MSDTPIDHQALYFHVRIVMSMVVGLALTHLLRGIARIINRPKCNALYWVHLVWVLALFLYILHFWWWEAWFLSELRWSFNLYFFLILYALLLYLLAALIFPEHMTEYQSYRDYFYSRRAWFFGLLALVYCVDFADTWLKGAEYFQARGTEYVFKNCAYIIVCGVAIASRNTWFHGTFALAGVVYQVSWIVREYEVL